MASRKFRNGVVAMSVFAFVGFSEARGFGGFRGGGGGGMRTGGGDWGGGMRSGGDWGGGGLGGAASFGGDRGGWGGYSGGWGGSRAGSFSGTNNFSSGAGAFGGGYASNSYNRDYSGSQGGSVDVSGTRGAASTGWGGYAAGGTRDVTATGPDGRTYSSDSQRGVAGNQYGAVAGGSRYATGSGANGSFARGSSWDAAGTRFPSDAGLANYSSFGAVSGAEGGTAYWSHSAMASQAGAVRGGFGYYGAFNSGWYAAHPAAWGAAAGWAAGNAWATPAWSTIYPYVGVDDTPVDYDYGTNVVYQNNDVYVNGTNVGTETQFAQQATTLATQGQQANPPQTTQWQSLGVFAMVQGNTTTSNYIFQIAVDQSGTIRGNFYDGVMDQTTPIYGSVDKTSQRAAWTIGDKKDRVYEAGIVNLTKDQTPVLVHMNNNKTEQLMLVRMKQPAQPQSPNG